MHPPSSDCWTFWLEVWSHHNPLGKGGKRKDQPGCPNRPYIRWRIKVGECRLLARNVITASHLIIILVIGKLSKEAASLGFLSQVISQCPCAWYYRNKSIFWPFHFVPLSFKHLEKMQTKRHLTTSYEGDVFVLSSQNAGTSETDPGSLCSTGRVSVQWHHAASWLNTTKSVSVKKRPLLGPSLSGGFFWLSAEAIHMYVGTEFKSNSRSKEQVWDASWEVIQKGE